LGLKPKVSRCSSWELGIGRVLSLKVGKCDLCDERKYIAEGRDSFDVHVLNLCAYGCNDIRSIPQENLTEIENIASCMNCTRVLKPENDIEYCSYWNSVFCSKYCAYCAQDYSFDEIDSITLNCNRLTKDEIKRYDLMIIDNRLYFIPNNERGSL